MGTDNPSPIFFTKWTKRPRFFGDVSSIWHLHRRHYDPRSIVHQSVRARITITPICNIFDAAAPKPPGLEPAGPEPPRAGAAAAWPKIIVEPASLASLALGMFCHKKIFQSF
jgi:hypothetical protein